MSKMLITGGAGFIGSHAADYFSRNNRVSILDNLSRGQMLATTGEACQFNLELLRQRDPTIEFSQADLRDFQGVKKAAHFADCIIHAGGQVAVTASLRDPRTDFEVNVTGTFNVLEAARINDSSLIFCSTNKVYGENVNEVPVREETSRYMFEDSKYSYGIPENFPLDHTRHCPYGTSKLAADVYVQDYARTYGLKTGVFRMSCIYGDRQFGVEDQGWLAWFAIATLTAKPITIYGNGKQVRDALYVGDLVDAFDLFLQSNIKHAVFNIGGGPQNTLSLLELLELLHRMTGRTPEVSFSDWRNADQKVYISDIRKAQEMLAWKPKVVPEEGVKRVVNWVRENRHLFT
jgi:CDP-paratose 2-epimerase